MLEIGKKEWSKGKQRRGSFPLRSPFVGLVPVFHVCSQRIQVATRGSKLLKSGSSELCVPEVPTFSGCLLISSRHLIFYSQGHRIRCDHVILVIAKRESYGSIFRTQVKFFIGRKFYWLPHSNSPFRSPFGSHIFETSIWPLKAAS